MSPFGVGRDRSGVTSAAAAARRARSPTSTRRPFPARSPRRCRRSRSTMRWRSTARAPRARGDRGGRPDPRRYSKASLIAVIAATEAWHDAGLRLNEPGAGVLVGSGAGGHRRRRAAVRRVLQRRLEARHALRDPGVDRRHDLERDLDRARAARHQPRRLDRLHQLDRRDLLRGVADSRRRGRRHPVGRRRRLRHARDDLRLLEDARGRDALQRHAGGSVAAVRPRARRVRARRRGVDGGARARGPRAGARRPIYATIDGYGSTCDAYHRVQMDPDGEQIVRAMRAGDRALRPGRSRRSATSTSTARPPS